VAKFTYTDLDFEEAIETAEQANGLGAGKITMEAYTKEVRRFGDAPDIIELWQVVVEIEEDEE
jgi:hypothetical protein